MSLALPTSDPTARPATALGGMGAAHAVLAAVLVLYPAVASDFFLTQIGGYSLILGMIALSLMLLAGYGGMVSLAQVSVAGMAGYTVAIFGLNNSGVHGFGWPWWIVILSGYYDSD